MEILEQLQQAVEKGHPGEAEKLTADGLPVHILNDLQQIFDRFDEWDQQINDLITQNEGIEKVLEVTSAFLGNPLVLMGLDFSLIAEAGTSQLPERAKLFLDDGINVEFMNALLQDEGYRALTQSSRTTLFPAYLNGFSSSLPMDIQIEALQTIPAFRNVQIHRPGYAIEYDFFDPTQLKHTLETKKIKNLFFAGQVNGTTGYEEAAGQGIMAGINAHINCHGGEPFVLARDEAYIGVLIDDLVTKGVDEPYRMFTSRAEYRILLRMDDADMRLTEKAWKLGLAKEDRYRLLTEKREAVNRIIDFTRNYSMKPALINPALEQLGTTPLRQGCKLIDLINRPQVTIDNIAEHVNAFKRELDKISDRKEEIVEAAEILIKYEGYIGRERIIADKLARLESIKIKGKFDYNSIQSLSTEARQKLMKIDPETIAQASRIPGVSPSDINVLLVLCGR